MTPDQRQRARALVETNRSLAIENAALRRERDHRRDREPAERGAGGFKSVRVIEALNGGITTLLDWSHVNNTPEHSDAAIHGLAEAGIRAIYAHGPPVGATWWA